MDGLDPEGIQRLIVELAPDPILLLDRKGNVLWCNKATSDSVGLPVEKIVGMNYADLPGFNPSDLPDHRKILEEVLTEESIKTVEVCWVAPDGRTLFAESRLAPVVTEQGKGVLIAGRNITKQRESEKALREESRKLKQYLDVAGVILVAFDPSGVVTMINRRGLYLLEVSEEEVLGKNWVNIHIPPEWRERVDERMRQVLAGRYSSDDIFENPIITTTGKRLIIRWRANRLQDTQGSVTGLLASGEDVTSLVESLQKTLEKEALLKATIEATTDAILILDSEQNVLLTNDNLWEMWDIPRTMKDKEGVTGILSHIQAYLEDPETCSLAKKEFLEREDTTRDYLRLKDGRIIHRYTAPLRLDEDRKLRIFNFRDVTEILKARLRAEASERRYRELVENLPVGVAIADEDERIQLANQALAKILDTNKESLLNQKLTKFIVQKDLGLLHAQTSARQKGVVSSYEVDMMTKSGEPRTVQIYAAPDKDEEGNIVGSLGIFMDVSEAKKAEIIARQQRDEIDLYSSLLRHDLRNDIGLLLNYIETIDMTLNGIDDETKEFLDSSKAIANRMNLLITSLGKPQDVKKHRLGDFITAISEEATQANKGLNARVVISPDLADRQVMVGGLLTLVFQNLYRNASQHAGTDAEVVLSVEESGDNLVFTVSDNGPGVPAEERDKVFRKGFSTKDESGGLGLYLCKEIVERLDGTIELVDTPEAIGASFRITLPSANLLT